jgi:ribosomal protein S15P/S13E
MRRLIHYYKGSHISVIMPLFKTKDLANNLRGLAYTQSKARKILSKSR